MIRTKRYITVTQNQIKGRVTSKKQSIISNLLHTGVYSISSEEEISVCIVLPTYNEVKNITNHLSNIFSSVYSSENKGMVNGKSVRLKALVVDDKSPDGTGQKVHEYSLINPDVHLFSRSGEKGLGAAYIAGFQRAIELFNPDIIFEMDSDGQHDPSQIMDFIKEIETGSDFVIGSRYVAGSSIAQEWGLHRKIISASARFATKTLLGVKHVKDCTSGYRAIRSDVVKQINFDTFEAKGYVFQAILLERAIRNGAVVTEIPISFGLRKEGESKMSTKEMINGFAVLLRARMNCWREQQQASTTRKIQRTNVLLGKSYKPRTNPVASSTDVHSTDAYTMPAYVES